MGNRRIVWDSIHLPTLSLPPAQQYSTPSLDLPKADIPSYKPLVVPPNNLKPPDGVKSESKEETPTGIREVKLPIIDFKLPVPENEILITAGTTAVVSVAATLTATAAFKWAVTAMKPLLKKGIGKIRKEERVNTRV